MILSFHDFYYVCPSINLIGPDNGYCYGKCSTKNIQCKYPLQIFGTMPILTEFIKTWRQESSLLIDMCITFTAPTKSTIDFYISIYPQLKHMNYKLIEHGRDFNETHVKFDLPSENKPIKIVVPGIIKHHKGQDLIKEIKENDIQNRIEFHFMGIVYDDLKGKGI